MTTWRANLNLPTLKDLLLKVADQELNFRLEYLWQEGWRLWIEEEIDGYAFECEKPTLNEITDVLNAFLKNYDNSGVKPKT